MTCCIERAVIKAVAPVVCDIVPEKDFAVIVADCVDRVPYAVVKSKTSVELTTSCGTKLRTNITIAFFVDTKEKAIQLRDLVEPWITESRGCQEIAGCGCLCVSEMTSSDIAKASTQGYRYQCVFRAAFSASEGSSSSS